MIAQHNDTEELLDTILTPTVRETCQQLAIRHVQQAPEQGAIKYVRNPDYWTRVAMGFVRKMGLHTMDGPRLTILEIGPGIGLFAALCQRHGHAVDRMEIPRDATCPSGDIYPTMHAALGIPPTKYLHRIEPMKPLPETGRYDLITCQFGAFHAGWSEENWEYLFAQLLDRTQPHGRLWLHLNRTGPYTEGHAAAHYAAMRVMEKDPRVKSLEVGESLIVGTI